MDARDLSSQAITVETAQALAALRERPSVFTRAKRLAKAKPLGAVSLSIIVAMWLIAIFADVIAPYGPNEFDLRNQLQPPSARHWFGTDNVGRDVYSRVIWASRLSLTVSVFSVTLGSVGGSLLGMVSGYMMGKVDLVLQRVVDAFQSIPQLILLMAIVAVLGTQIIWVFAALVFITIPRGGRIIRSAVISVRENMYVDAARAIGCGQMRVLFRHIMPNVFAPFLILISVGLGANLLTQASLSFLGLVDSAYPDWGGMLNIGARRYLERMPWLMLAPGIVISVAVLSYNMLGDAVRDVLDPRMRGT